MEIYVLSQDLDIMGILVNYEAIIWNPKFHEPGSFKASFLFTERVNEMMQRGRIIYKTDEDEPAVITRKFLKLNKFGEQTIQVQGYMLSRYLNQRIIWNRINFSGKTEVAMREMVYQNAIAPAIPDRIIPRLELGTLKGYEDTIERQMSYGNLQEELTAISKVSELGYKLMLDIADKKIYFEVYKGTDRTAGSENPCVFSREFGNVYTQDYSEDATNYRNVCLVGGTGEDEDRIMQTVGEASGLDRYEMFYNASGLSNKDISAEEYLAQLGQKGKEKLADYYVAKAFENKVNSAKAMKHNLGDYVTCTDKQWNITMDTQIKAIEKGLSKEEKSIFITFGDDVPTMISLIKAKE